jgi:hypothetical protein
LWAHLIEVCADVDGLLAREGVVEQLARRVAIDVAGELALAGPDQRLLAARSWPAEGEQQKDQGEKGEIAEIEMKGRS